MFEPPCLYTYRPKKYKHWILNPRVSKRVFTGKREKNEKKDKNIDYLYSSTLNNICWMIIKKSANFRNFVVKQVVGDFFSQYIFLMNNLPKQ